ncbi:glycosyltransferase [Lusitaniella coriacea]|uniref:glycosyltransferase n=1 Tax=Lusitaniella coriacea TaxID=1983105 RepID=UPI003CF1814D
MKVLIADFDLFKTIGGGQTFYRRIIETNPSIEFYYLIRSESSAAKRPDNAKVIAYQEKYFLCDIEEFGGSESPKWIHRAFIIANNIATSVANQSFDLVDLPDYEQFGTVLRPALKHHQVDFKCLALSMHGKISTTLRLNWANQINDDIALDIQEKMQYQTVDIRYGISKSYLDEWREGIDLESHYFNPIHFFPFPKPTSAEPSNDLPSLNFIGRTEKRKGADIFIDLVWWLPRSSFSGANIIGPESYDGNGNASSGYLQSAINNRSLDIGLHPAMNREELEKVFANKSITFLPSRYDSLNLLALESLFSGCPTAIGSGAGVCRFLQETFPGIPFISIDVKEVYSCLPEVVSVLENYDAYRQDLVERLQQLQIKTDDPKLEDIYQSSSAYNSEITEQLDFWYEQLIQVWEFRQEQKNQPIPSAKRLARGKLRELKKFVKQQIRKDRVLEGDNKNSDPEQLNLEASGNGNPNSEQSEPKLISQVPPLNLKNKLKSKLITSVKKVFPNVSRDDLRLIAQAVKAPWLIQKYKNAFDTLEQTEEDLASKLKQYWILGAIYDPEKALLLNELNRFEQINGIGKSIFSRLNRRFGTSFRIDRARVWKEIARLERMRGNDLVAATYLVRGMRDRGDDRFNDLPWIVQTLNHHGFHQEAQTAQALYGDPQEREQRCTELLDKALLNNLYNQPWEYEFIDDRRDAEEYRVSIIVSLYNAASKLPLFLKALRQQTLIQKGAVEIILIDSGSPGDEYAVFKQLMTEMTLPIVYARSRQRETIQSAWNRGIAMARSRYLSFLGADETILPDCLEVLADELDKDPELDWVLGDSLVTSVDPHGTWVSDIMTYDRAGYSSNLVYLETCYLSWVGALYRRSIHDRFGYYNATFRAAGDTEFKNRVLPFIKTKHIPRTLGLFWNYPEERTTQHPRAELEDLRAWYLHRSIAGVQYAFQNRLPEEAEALFFQCLRYRKSYCQHWSTDIEYANNIACYLQKVAPTSSVSQFHPGVQQLLNTYRSLDYLPHLSTLEVIKTVIRAKQIAANLEKEHRQLDPQKADPIYRVFNDNRYEQHSFLWLTDL